MRFSYKEVSSGILRPIIPITLRSKDSELGYFALIDSGADACIFPAELAEALNLNERDGTPRELTGVVQGQTRVYFTHTIEIEVGTHIYTTTVGFMKDFSRLGYGLLGQHGFFDQFSSVNLQLPKQSIDISL